MTNPVAGSIPALSDKLASPLQKSWGRLHAATTAEDVAAKKWNLLREDLSLPAAVLHQDRMLHNAAWMQRFIGRYNLKLAPHGKTTMAPKLFQLQLENGAWGITLATAHQCFIAYAHGVRRVLMANELVGRGNMEIISRLLEDASFEFYCLVDSTQGVEQLGTFFAERGQQVRVLLELGVAGGRAGVRDEAQLTDVLEAVRTHKAHVLLSGIEVYEGVLREEASIRTFLQHAVSVTRRILAENGFARQPAILSGAGSAWYDVVAEEFSSANLGADVYIVLRPGCYLSHDVGIYLKAQEQIMERNPVAQSMHGGLRPALEVWAYVQSIPEQNVAIVGLGKRDAAFDAGLPTPAWHYRPGNSAPTPTPAGWGVTKMMDQHAYLEIANPDEVRVGDMIGFDISHPCLTFDKWGCIAVVNTKFDVVDVVPTYF